MKKLILIIALFTLNWSCNDDDDDSNSESTAKPISMSISPGILGDARTFTYDEKNRLATITVEGENRSIEYNENNTVSAVTSSNDSYEFVYDDEGKLTTIGDLEVIRLGDGEYMLDGANLSFDENGDWKSFGPFTFTFSSDKGAFANVKHLDLLAVFLADNTSYYYASKKNLTSVIDGNQTIPSTSVSGTDGLPESFNLYGGNFTFTYSE